MQENLLAWSSISAHCCQRKTKQERQKTPEHQIWLARVHHLRTQTKHKPSSRRQGAAKTQKQDTDTGTRRSHKAHDSCSDINGASCQGGSEGHRSEFRNTLRSIGFASWSSAPLLDFMFLSQAGYQRTSCPFVHLGTGASALDQR